ncbi:MAG TPA: carboxypeptidase regulatory-like domain-containing protein, partial [Vicinamibacterales bacterium]|nr:carboxypeptidase regulatory-like domain-containing protein [Vicinamibacterales bacterium]
FEFTGVPAARVQVTASRTGYFDYDNLWNGEPEDPQWQPVAAGQRIQGVRIALYRGGVVTGRIRDEFGEPAAGVEVEVLRREPGDRDGSVRTMSSPITPTTDDTGAFRVWGLPPGDYLVGARPNRFVADASDTASEREGYAATYYPGTPSLASARAVRVEPGKETGGLAFQLVSVPLATVRGRVQLPPETSGRAINLGLGLVAPQRLDGYVTRGARARDDGSFELPRLAPGTYQVTARHFRQGGVEYYGTTEIEVTGTDVDGVYVPLRQGAVVRGRVVDEAGQPVGVPVMVSLHLAGPGRAPVPRPGRTYSDGSFRLEGAFGRVRVRAVEARVIPGAEAPGINVRSLQDVTPATRPLTTWWLKSIMLNGRDVTDEPIDLDQGHAALEITMTNRASSVRGTVTWNRARGGRRPSVVVFVDDDTRWTRPSRLVGAAEVDEAGRYDVRGLPPGERYLAAAVEGAARAVLARPEMLAALRAAATPLRIDEGGVYEVPLTARPRPQP